MTSDQNHTEPLLCPVCGQATGPDPLRAAARLIPVQGHRVWHEPDRLIAAAGSGELRWACPECMAHGRALGADPARQTFCDHPPYLAYYDAQIPCEDCHGEFIFSAAEQRRWYEESQFPAQSWPRQCPDCRRQRRERARLNQLRRQGLQPPPEAN